MPDIEGRENTEHDEHEHAKQLHSQRPWVTGRRSDKLSIVYSCVKEEIIRLINKLGTRI